MPELPAQHPFHVLYLTCDPASPAVPVIDRDVGKDPGCLPDHVFMTGSDHLDYPFEIALHAGLHGTKPVFQTRTVDDIQNPGYVFAELVADAERRDGKTG